MLKYKYLFDNRDLAEMLLKNWAYDPDSLELFKQYRISSNAVYPFRAGGELRFLRFAPVGEKLETNMKAELEFLAYLRANGYGAMEPAPDLEGRELVKAETPWGTYWACVFKNVPGVQLSRTDLSGPVVFSYGRALGELHRLSTMYEPVQAARWTYLDVLDWITEVLSAHPDKSGAALEAGELRACLAEVPVTDRSYGLIHYDFECDNMFYHAESQLIFAIDFDDAMYHWYAMDIEQALDSLRDELPSDAYVLSRERFLDGYRSAHELPPGMEELLPLCRRFADLYRYARVRRAAAEVWEHEPEWLTGLRERLDMRLKGRYGLV